MADGWRDASTPTGRAWEGLQPGPELSRALADVDPASLDPGERVSYLAASERLAGWAYVVQARALVAVSDAVHEATEGARGSVSMRQSWVADEIAAALHIAPRTATVRVNAASAVVRDWPLLGARVASGQLTFAQAREIYEGVGVLSGTLNDAGEDLSEVAVRTLVRVAGDLPPARLRERVARVVASLDPGAAARRRKDAERDRTDVSVWAEADGIACLAARGPSIDAVAVHSLIDARARDMRATGRAIGDERTLGQWRHAALLAAFGLAPVTSVPLSPEASPAVVVDPARGDDPTSRVDLARDVDPALEPPRVEVRVTVPLSTLLGLTDSPGELDGFGPIDPELARALAADADWVRWVTDPVGDYLIDSGSRRFPGARLARFLRERETRCKHPSCGVRSRHCDADHLPAYAEGGRTAAATMSPTCPRHNRGRDASRWRVEEDSPTHPSGPPDPTWVSPLGRRYWTSLPNALLHDHIPLRT